MQTYVPTNFEKYSTKDFVNNSPIKYSIWDTSGSSNYDSIRPLAYPDANVFILAFNVTDPDSFHLAVNKVSYTQDGATLLLYIWVCPWIASTNGYLFIYFLQWLPEIRSHCPNTPIVFCGCASDLRGDVKTLAKLSQSNYGEPIAREYATRNAELMGAVDYIETSSAYGDDKGVYEVFAVAAKAALAHITISMIYEAAMAEAKSPASTLPKKSHNTLNCMRIGSRKKKEAAVVDPDMFIYHGLNDAQIEEYYHQQKSMTLSGKGKSEYERQMKGGKNKNCSIM